MKINRLGVRSLVFAGASVVALELFARWFPAIGMLAFFGLQISALVYGVKAALRGSKLWLLVPAWSVCFLVILFMSIYSE